MIFLTPKLALGGVLTALALGCTAISAQTGAGLARGPVACSVDMTARAGLLTVEGVVTATEAISGSYHLRVARGGTLMNQGGSFDLRPGETARLGQVTLNGPASGLEVDLTLEADDRTIRCPVDL
jgi:hypothetical protein